MRTLCRWQLYGWLFLLPLLSQGQEEVLYFHRLTVDQNLTSQNYNYYIFKDSQGFVWISSVNGLNRYDGYQVKSYLPDNQDSFSLASSHIHSMFFENQQGNLWFSTDQALQLYDRKKNHFKTFYLQADGQRLEGEYQLLHLDTLHQKLWVRVGDQLFIQSLATQKEPTFLGIFPPNHRWRIQKLKPSGDYLLVVPDSTGLQTCLFRSNNAKSPTPGRIVRRLLGFEVKHTYLENEDRLWVGTNRGLVLLNLLDNSVRLYNDFFTKKVNNIIGITPLHNDWLIIATANDGIYYFNKKNQQFTHQLYADDEGTIVPFLLPISKIYLDADHTLWISTTGRGVYFVNLKKKKFHALLQNRVGSPANQHFIRAMAEDHFGRIWCLYQSGIQVLTLSERGDALTSRQHWQKVPFAEAEPFYIFCDRSNRIWVCTNEGLYVLPANGSKFTKVPVESAVRKTGFTFIAQLSNDKILVSSQADGIFEVQEDQAGLVLRRYAPLANRSGEFTWIFEDSQQRLYFYKSNTGISIYRTDGDNLVFDTTLTLHPMVNAITEDHQKQGLWIATEQALFYLQSHKGRYALYQDTVFTLEAALNGLLQDEQGRLWISTNKGLTRYTPHQRPWRTYTPAEGLQATEFRFWCFLKTRKNLLGFGGVNGVNFFHPAAIEDLPVPARPVLTTIYINDQEATDLVCESTQVRNVSLLRRLVLPYRQNTVAFRFAPLEYSDPAANAFRFQLQNVDDTLVNSNSDNFARYPNLRPGDYTFIVQATNSDGKWSEQVAQVQLIILPPWYQTWWARSLFILAFLGCVYIIYRFRIEEVERREAFRRKEAEYKQHVAENETAVLRLQMNPHFIFNSMNSISSYILQKDVVTANDYLHRFAALMRTILEFAEHPTIPVADEIQLLEQYLEAENMRMTQKFTYCIEHHPDLDLDEVELPTMIVQPFVENAIWHGLATKPGNGCIHIQFWQEGAFLLCSVQDNGIGRAAAQKNRAKTHDSKALWLTQRRLLLLEKTHGRAGSFEFVDLHDEHGTPAGTKVLLRIPLLQLHAEKTSLQ